MTQRKVIDGSVLIQHIIDSLLPSHEKVTLLQHINHSGKYFISTNNDSNTITAHSRKCQLQQYISNRDIRYINKMYQDDSVCHNVECAFKNNKKRSKCALVTQFIEILSEPPKDIDSSTSTISKQCVIPGELLNKNFSGRNFVYQKECQKPVCNHIFAVASLKNVGRYCSRKDLLLIADQPDLNNNFEELEQFHKATILRQFLNHTCTRLCEPILHFVEVFDDM